jgi:hypothetical protein
MRYRNLLRSSSAERLVDNFIVSTRRKKHVSLFLSAGITIYVQFIHQRIKYGNEANYFVMQNPY